MPRDLYFQVKIIIIEYFLEINTTISRHILELYLTVIWTPVFETVVNLPLTVFMNMNIRVYFVFCPILAESCQY